MYRYRAGIPWRDLPERLGNRKNTHRRFSRWAKRGVWERIYQHLAADADNEYGMIDSTITGWLRHVADLAVRGLRFLSPFQKTRKLSSGG